MHFSLHEKKKKPSCWGFKSGSGRPPRCIPPESALKNVRLWSDVHSSNHSANFFASSPWPTSSPTAAQVIGKCISSCLSGNTWRSSTGEIQGRRYRKVKSLIGEILPKVSLSRRILLTNSRSHAQLRKNEIQTKIDFSSLTEAEDTDSAAATRRVQNVGIYYISCISWVNSILKIWQHGDRTRSLFICQILRKRSAGHVFSVCRHGNVCL